MLSFGFILHSWRSVTVRDDLSSSFLCDTTSYTTQLDVNTLTDMYNVTIAQLLDVHAPKTKVTWLSCSSSFWPMVR